MDGTLNSGICEAGLGDGSSLSGAIGRSLAFSDVPDQLGLVGFLVSLVLHAGALLYVGYDSGQYGAIESEIASVSENVIAIPIEVMVMPGDLEERSASDREAAERLAGTAAELPKDKELSSITEMRPEPEPDKQPEPQSDKTSAEPQPQPAPPVPPVVAETDAPTAPLPPIEAVDESATIRTAEVEAPESTPAPVEPVADKPVERVAPKTRTPLQVLKPKQRPATPEVKRTVEKNDLPRAERSEAAIRSAAANKGSQHGRVKGITSQSTGSRSASPGQARAYAAQVQARIASRRPGGRGEAGTVAVSFAVSTSGSLVYARVSRSSGNGGLDAMALATVRGAAPFPPPPQGLSARDRTFQMPFRFR